MEKLTKKLVAVCLIVVLILSFTACSKAPEEVEQPASNMPAPAITADNPHGLPPMPKEKITYEFFFEIGFAPEFPDNGGPAKEIILNAMKEYGFENVDYHVTLVGGEEYYTKLNMLAASNDLPDFFQVRENEKIRFAEQKLLMPLDNYLANHMPSYSSKMNKDDMEQTKYNGVTYALPAIRTSDYFNGTAIFLPIVREDWLKNVNMDQPTTIDELYEVLKAFTYNDPDRNGKDDTYGMGAWKDDNFEMIQGAYGIQDEFWFERDGILKQGVVLPEMRQALETLSKWYAEGLIEPDFPMLEQKQMWELFINSKIGVKFDRAIEFGETETNFHAFFEANPNGNYVEFPFPMGPEGKKGLKRKFTGIDTTRAMSAKAKYPEVLARLLDWATDYEEGGGAMLLNYGIEGEHYIYDREANFTEALLPVNEMYKLGFSNPVRFIPTKDGKYMNPTVREKLTIINDPANGNLISSAFDMTVPAMQDYPDLITKLFREYFAKIVTGELPVSAHDEFIEKYYKQGGKLIEEQVNEAYKEMKNN